MYITALPVHMVMVLLDCFVLQRIHHQILDHYISATVLMCWYQLQHGAEPVSNQSEVCIAMPTGKFPALLSKVGASWTLVETWLGFQYQLTTAHN